MSIIIVIRFAAPKHIARKTAMESNCILQKALSTLINVDKARLIKHNSRLIKQNITD